VNSGGPWCRFRFRRDLQNCWSSPSVGHSLVCSERHTPFSWEEKDFCKQAIFLEARKRTGLMGSDKDRYLAQCYGDQQENGWEDLPRHRLLHGFCNRWNGEVALAERNCILFTLSESTKRVVRLTVRRAFHLQQATTKGYNDRNFNAHFECS
jgi:hypothetical protein